MDKEELQTELDILFNPKPDGDGFFPPEYPPELITKFHKLDISYMDRLDYEGSTIHPYTQICRPDEHRLISLSRNHDVFQRLSMSAIQLFGDSIIAYHDKKERKGMVTFMTREGLEIAKKFCTEDMIRRTEEIVDNLSL